MWESELVYKTHLLTLPEPGLEGFMGRSWVTRRLNPYDLLQGEQEGGANAHQHEPDGPHACRRRVLLVPPTDSYQQWAKHWAVGSMECSGIAMS